MQLYSTSTFFSLLMISLRIYFNPFRRNIIAEVSSYWDTKKATTLLLWWISAVITGVRRSFSSSTSLYVVSIDRKDSSFRSFCCSIGDFIAVLKLKLKIDPLTYFFLFISRWEKECGCLSFLIKLEETYS